ncbi:O-antigen polymerase, WsfB [Thermobacillus xylanilyticus]|uniref:O-antigen polymerase, WsfB n=2 Tax=Thermobacillus xylanilyticus TaxID=76633 RepID=A0ABN7RTS1_THEXY|nr:O-antigen polymerase, WsfB [Thermobacillus xylanilyticus]
MIARLYFVWKVDQISAIYSVGILLIPLIYWISTFQAASYHNAVLMVLVTSLLACLFIMGLYLGTTPRSLDVLQTILLLSGYAVILYGTGVVLGLAYTKDAIWFTSGTYRLTSVFQYSNTYAGFLLAFLMGAMFTTVNAKRTWIALMNAAMLTPIWMSLMLTYSRGALIFIPLLVLVILFFLRLDRQIAFVIAFIGSALVTVFTLSPITERYIQIAQIVMPKRDGEPANLLSIQNSLVWQTALILLIGSLVTTLLIWGIRTRYSWLEKKLSALSGRKFASFIVPVGLGGAGILGLLLLLGTGIASSILPSSIAERLQNINFQQHSVLERKTFYVDALKLTSDYPLFGSGGGGWSALYEKYQNNPYVSRQTHSFFAQTLVEIGWVGFSILLLILCVIFFQYLKQYWRERQQQPSHFIFFILAFTLLAHSLIDFDMSYVYIAGLVFFSLGVLVAVYDKKISLTLLKSKVASRWRFLYHGALAVVTLVLIVQAYQEYVGSQYFKSAINKAINEKPPLDELLVTLDQAISYSPKHPAYLVTKIDWLGQAYHQTGDRSYALQAKELIEQIKSTEPYDRQIILSEYRNHKDLGEYNESIEALEEGISKFQWDIKFYEAAIMEYAVNGNSVKDTDPAKAQTYWNRGMELYEEVLHRKQLLMLLPEEQLQGRDFDVTPFIRQAVGQILFGQGRYEDAVSMLKPMVENDLSDVYNRIGVRYYLAALYMLGQSDADLLNRLVEAGPNEKMYLDSLLQ